MPEKVQQLESLWAAWNRSNVTPLWGSSGNRDNDGPEPGAAPEKTGRKAKKRAANAK